LSTLFNLSVIISLILSSFLSGVPASRINSQPESQSVQPFMQNITTPTPEATKVGETVTPEVTQTPEPTQEVVSEKKSIYQDWAPVIELSTEEDFAEPGKKFSAIG
jgi:hypothetical protein